MSDINYFENSGIRTIGKIKLPSDLTKSTGDGETPVEYQLADLAARDRLNTIMDSIYNAIYPIGCLFWTSNKDFNPGSTFGGKWVKISGAYIYAAENENDVTVLSDDNLSSLKRGSNSVTLTLDNLPEHLHKITDPGHEHRLITKGIGIGAYGNLGNTSNGINATDYNANTGIKTTVDYANINSTDYAGSKTPAPVNIDPIHICRFCWERIS